MSTIKTAEIAKGIYWVGGSGQKGGLHCNPYLLVDGDEAVLFDPGSVLDFEYVFENVCSLVPLEKVKYVVLHHQDPDFCSSVPLFEKKGADFRIVTHWRTQTLVKFYGITSEYYIVNEHDFKLKLESGRELSFVQTPYLHFPGAIATYDSASETLFSSDLFGAFSHEWSLYAGEDYIEKMKTFHEHYMPSNDIIRPVMEVLLGMDISVIAPQHGSVIKDNVQQYIRVLRDLECGAFLNPLKKDLAKSGGYRSICSSIIKRYASVFSKDEALEIIRELRVAINPDTLEITDYSYTGIELWNLIFEKVLALKGIQWLLPIEPFVQKLSKEYDIPVPQVFLSSLQKAKAESLNLDKENKLLRDTNKRLENSIRETQEKLIRDPVTGLYNYEFFKSYSRKELEYLISGGSQQNPALLVIGIDNLTRIGFSYGENEADEVLRSIVYLINSIKDENILAFRFLGAAFACYMPHTTMAAAVALAEEIRNAIGSSEKFIEAITVSVGVVCLEELLKGPVEVEHAEEAMCNIALMRVRLARSMGMNIVCSSSSVVNYQDELGKIMIVDTDAINIDVLRTFLENLNYKVMVAEDGDEALKLTEKEDPDLIISEIMIPKLDGFLFREKLLSQSQTKDIPFIIVSHLKNDDSVKRAAKLKIEHYFKKPFMLSELLGVVKNKVKGEAYQ